MKKIGNFAVAVAVIGVCVGASMAAPHSDSCNKCHVPHNAGDPAALAIPLWNPASFTAPLATFTLYSSMKFDDLHTDIGQPDGASKVCLGCHDGSYSLFQDPMANQKNIIKPEDLGRSHPISFTYNAGLSAKVTDGSLRNPDTANSGLGTGRSVTQDLLDANKKMQCTSCHDVHMTGYGTYHLRWNDYVVGTSDGNMCRVCHQK